MAVADTSDGMPLNLNSIAQDDEEPPPSYQEAIGPSMDIALKGDLVCALPTVLTMERLLSDYWVYKPNRDLLFRTHTLMVAKGIKVTHIPSNSKVFVMQTRKRSNDWQYYAETVQNGSTTTIFDIEPHDKFIKGDVAHMRLRNDFTCKDEVLDIRKNRGDQRWEVWYKEHRITDIDFPSSSSRWKIRILAPGVDPSIMIAITLVIVVGAKKLES